MVKIQKVSVLLCIFLLFSCDENIGTLKCSNTENLFYKPSIENHLGDSIAFFEIQESNDLLFRLDDKRCHRDSCSFYVYSLSTFGVNADSMMSLRYYLRTKRWNAEDVIIKCDFVQKFETNDNESSGYLKFLDRGNCPVLVKSKTDSCSYQEAILHVDSTIYFERVF